MCKLEQMRSCMSCGIAETLHFNDVCALMKPSTSSIFHGESRVKSEAQGRKVNADDIAKVNSKCKGKSWRGQCRKQ